MFNIGLCLLCAGNFTKQNSIFWYTPTKCYFHPCLLFFYRKYNFNYFHAALKFSTIWRHTLIHINKKNECWSSMRRTNTILCFQHIQQTKPRCTIWIDVWCYMVPMHGIRLINLPNSAPLYVFCHNMNNMEPMSTTRYDSKHR